MDRKKKSYKRLTIDQLKGYKGCEHYTDEEAEEIIDTLEQLTIVLFKLHQKNLKDSEGNNSKISDNT